MPARDASPLVQPEDAPARKAEGARLFDLTIQLLRAGPPLGTVTLPRLPSPHFRAVLRGCRICDTGIKGYINTGDFTLMQK